MLGALVKGVARVAMWGMDAKEVGPRAVMVFAEGFEGVVLEGCGEGPAGRGVGPAKTATIILRMGVAGGSCSQQKVPFPWN